MGHKYSKLPSEILGITDELAAWNLNLITLITGLNKELEGAEQAKSGQTPLGSRGGSDLQSFMNQYRGKT